MNKKAQNWQLGIGAILILLGAYIYTYYSHLLGFVLIAVGIGIIVSKQFS